MSVPEVDPQVRDLCRRLLPEVPELNLGMVDRIVAEIPVYRDPLVVPREDLVASCEANMGYILGTLAGDHVALSAPRRTGSVRAEQGVPYAALLKAFRVGGRHIWELLVSRADPESRESLLLAAAEVWAVTDDLSEQVTEAYQGSLSDLARRDGQMRSTLLATLLEEVVASEQLWHAATVLNLPHEGEFVVVVGESPAPGEEALDGVEGLLRRREVASVWRLDHAHHEGLVSLRVGYRLSDLANDLAAVSRGRVGVSPSFGRLDLAGPARQQARLACAAASPSTNEVCRFDAHPTAVLLASTPHGATAYAQSVLGPALALPAEDRDLLLETARTWLAEAGSTSAAAELLFLHRNTVRYRLRRLEELTGRSLGHPVEAAEVYLALECARLSGRG